MSGKSAAGSVTIWGALVVLLAQLAQLAGYTISESDQAALVNLIDSGVTVATTIVSILGAVAAMWGRVRATRPIVSTLPQK
jgi:cell division protein FtsX